MCINTTLLTNVFILENENFPNVFDKNVCVRNCVCAGKVVADSELQFVPGIAGVKNLRVNAG